MSYLELSTGLADFDKAVISLWFRVPNETLQSVRAQPVDDIDDDGFGTYIPPLYKMIPLITFGSVETAFSHTSDAVTAPLYPMSPSYIGVDCSDDDIALLAVNLQMSSSTTFSQEPEFIGDITRFDAFYMGGYGVTPFTSEDPQMLQITPDQWHHILISFDLSLGCSCYTPDFEEVPFLPPRQITPGPTFTWAFDDEDKVGPSMSRSGGAMYISGPGATIPMAPIPHDSIIPSALYDYVEAIAPAGGITATWNPIKIASAGNSIATPTAAQFIDNVYPVELAELQFFAGVTLDTSIEANRRAFINADGTPVDPAPMIDNPDYDPALPESASNPKRILDPAGGPAAQLLGQKPDILLHGSGNWIKGTNTGPMIDNPDYDPGQPISADNPVLIPDPALQFTPTGKIVSYTPDPSLHGPQSLGPPPAVRLERRIRVPA